MFSSMSLSNQRYLVLPAILIMGAAVLSAMPEDLSLDGKWDIVTSNKKGVHVFLQMP